MEEMLKSSKTSTQALPQVQRKQSSTTTKSSAHCYHQHQAQIKTKVTNLSEFFFGSVPNLIGV